MSELSKKEILENRKKWADYLIEKRLYKVQGWLQKHKGTSCCCLGHACNVFKIPRKVFGNVYYFGEDEKSAFAPEKLIELLRLYDCRGSFYIGKGFFFDEQTRTFHKCQNKKKNRKYFNALVDLNDYTHATPREIGMFIKAHINDGLIFEKV